MKQIVPKGGLSSLPTQLIREAKKSKVVCPSCVGVTVHTPLKCDAHTHANIRVTTTAPCTLLRQASLFIV